MSLFTSPPHMELTRIDWRISTHSADAGGNCVEAGALGGGRVAVRDSRNRGSGVLAVGTPVWGSFASAAASGRFTTARS